MDIRKYLDVNSEEANNIASVIWPNSSQKKEYKLEAKRRKTYLKAYGPFLKTYANLLDHTSRQLANAAEDLL